MRGIDPRTSRMPVLILSLCAKYLPRIIMIVRLVSFVQNEHFHACPEETSVPKC